MPQSHDARAEGPSGGDLATLIQAVVAGDQMAMARLYDTTSALIYGLVLRILSDPSEAQDVTLEVYLQVWRQAAQYDPQRGTLLAWLGAIAHSRALDRRRMNRRHQQREEPLEMVAHVPEATPDPAEASVIRQQQHLVQEALQSLAPEQREAIELAYFAGLSHRAIATRLAQPLGTIKTRIRLGMQHLRARLVPVVGEP